MTQPIWNTSAGSLGSFPALLALSIQLSASAQSPATSIQYTLLSGTLPTGISMSATGLISGTPALVTVDVTSTFTIRVTDNLSSIRDRTFSMQISGAALPQFTTPDGNLLSTQDSIWTELPILYSNPYASNKVIILLKEGELPPGLEISEEGVIRGYPNPPIVNNTLNAATTNATETESGTNLITCATTTHFSIGRPVVFTGSVVFGGINPSTTYYIRTIVNATTFSISTTPGGAPFPLISDIGLMTVTLPATSVGSPAIRTYSFILKLVSDLGGDTASYSITVINQNTPVSEGGPGKTANTRIPAILNTRPLTYITNDADPYYGYYILPPVLPADTARIGTIQSGDYFAFKIIGDDFDGNSITYSYSGLPLGLAGDPVTGWITGTPVISPGINSFSFSASVSKTATPGISSVYFNFGLNVSNGITETITWITPVDLGTIFNGTISTLRVVADAGVPLTYRIVGGSLPPNLTLLTNGEITGYVADQPTESFLTTGENTTFTFTIQAYSLEYSIIQSNKTFTIDVLQEYGQPTDILYIRATPSISDRHLIDSLLTSEMLIPTEDLYRADDGYFGKATSVIYAHAYGIYSSDIDEYIAAVTTNHYWRNITLGELKTASAKNDLGEVIYEVVYSEVIDNLINPSGKSVSSSIYWPRPIDLSLGPWYTSITDIYASYETVLDQQYYTSLTSGYARSLYTNSLINMRNKVASSLGQEYDSRLLPLWMTSQQANGSTLGYTQAWVICYTEPKIVVDGVPLSYAEFAATGKDRTKYSSYAETIKNNINTLWYAPDGTQNTLNQINFGIDRFTVDKSSTYNYDKHLNPAAWTGLPSATPVPDPLNSKDFTILFPRKTILPNTTQY